MANELPTFEQLLQAQIAARGGNPAQSALTGINTGIDLGRSILEKQRDEEERKRQFLLKIRDLQSKTLQPGDTAETVAQRERTPEVQAAITPKPKELKEPGNLVKLSENEEGVLVYDPATRTTKTIPFKGKKKEAGATLKIQQLDSASTMLQNVEQILSTLPSGIKGLGQEVLSKNIAGRGLFANKNARTYDQVTPAAAVAIYRGVTGDTRLSDADAASRARPLLPYQGEPAEVRKAKLDFLNKLIADQKQATAGGTEPTPIPIETAIVEQQKYLTQPKTGGEILTAVNPSTGERIQSSDGGQTWQPAK